MHMHASVQKKCSYLICQSLAVSPVRCEDTDDGAPESDLRPSSCRGPRAIATKKPKAEEGRWVASSAFLSIPGGRLTEGLN